LEGRDERRYDEQTIRCQERTLATFPLLRSARTNELKFSSELFARHRPTSILPMNSTNNPARDRGPDLPFLIRVKTNSYRFSAIIREFLARLPPVKWISAEIRIASCISVPRYYRDRSKSPTTSSEAKYRGSRTGSPDRDGSLAYDVSTTDLPFQEP
jgi:hypothetical protein